MFMSRDIPEPVVGEWARELEAELPSPPSVNAWRARLSPELNHRARAAYYAYMAYVDAQIGRFVEFLDRRRLSANTLFLFTADHGEMLGDHHLWRKTCALDPSARIPLILRPPQGWKAQRNARSDALVGLEDVMPTLLAAAGVEVPEAVEGRDLMPLAAGGDFDRRAYYHHEHSPCYSPENAYQSLTGEDWKYVWNPVTGAERLFYRGEDPGEENDLAGDPANSATLEAWRSKLAAHLAGRPEGLSDGKKLITGDVPVWRDPRGSRAEQ
jgi:arylsulfatase A-like enzyme